MGRHPFLVQGVTVAPPARVHPMARCATDTGASYLGNETHASPPLRQCGRFGTSAPLARLRSRPILLASRMAKGRASPAVNVRSVETYREGVPSTEPTEFVGNRAEDGDAVVDGQVAHRDRDLLRVPPRRRQMHGDRSRRPRLPTDLGQRQPVEPLPRVLQPDHRLGSIGSVSVRTTSASMTAGRTPGAAVPSSTPRSSRTTTRVATTSDRWAPGPRRTHRPRRRPQATAPVTTAASSGAPRRSVAPRRAALGGPSRPR